ncbi:lysozyme [uncultured Pseudomonas sp.]|uniref:lysozyme n=1 Tax=uncultured Pseudomonas sp. TaxID=114707 RepID=UPI00258A0C0C|nr:lysozyme [uncultured Pseudomonas sp.]
MRTSAEGIALMHHYESCRLSAYPDPGSVDGRPWTIGWGHTGPEVKRGLVWTQAQADTAFLRDLQATEYLVEKMAPTATQAEFDALVSFAYNLGAAALRGSTLMRLYQAGDKTGAAEQFLRWDKNDGAVLHGLTKRRNAERSLFLGATSAVAIAIGDRAKRAIA